MNLFALTLGLGASLGLYRVSRQRSGQWLDAALLVLLLSLIGARLGFAAERYEYFSSHLGEILAFYKGGLSAGGAVVGWVLGLGLASALHRVPVLRMADWLYPLIPPLAIAGLMASWLAGSGYGPALPAGTWWGVPTPDETGLLSPRWPLQPVAALALLFFYMLMEMLTPLPRPSGWLASLASAWFASILLVVSMLRADPVPVWGQQQIHVDTLSSLIFLAFFLGLLVVLTFIARRKNRL